MKKAVSLFAVLALAASLAACGGVADGLKDKVTDKSTTVLYGEPTSTEPAKQGDNETKNGITKIEGGEIVPTTTGTPTRTRSLENEGVEFEYSMPNGWFDMGPADGTNPDFALVYPGLSTNEFVINIAVIRSPAQYFGEKEWNNDYGYVFSPALGLDEFTKYTVGDKVLYSGTRDSSGGVQMTQTFAVLVKDGVLYEVALHNPPGHTEDLLPQFAEFISSIK